MVPVPGRGDLRLAAADQAHVVAGPAHVDRDEVGRARRARDVAGGDHPAGRPGAKHGDRLPGDVGRGHEAAIRLHEQQVAGIAGTAQFLFEVAQVTLDLRRDVGVHERRRGAFELGRLRQDLARQREIHAGQFLGRDFPRAALVHRVHEREQEDDRERLDLLEPESAQRAAQSVLVEGLDDVSLEVEALGHPEPPPSRADRRRRRVGRIPDALLVPAPEFDLVAVPRRGDEPGHRPIHLDHRVVGRRRPVDDPLGRAEEAIECESLARRQATEPVHDALALVVEGGRGLVEVDRMVGAHKEQVGKGPAHVDTDPVPGGRGALGRAQAGRRGALAATGRHGLSRRAPGPGEGPCRLSRPGTATDPQVGQGAGAWPGSARPGVPRGGESRKEW